MQAANLPVHVGRRVRFILPTAEWFDPLQQYTAGLAKIGMDLRKVIETTIGVTIRAACRDPRQPLPHVAEYHNLLTRFLLQIDADYERMDDPNLIAVLAEASTHFYNELTLLFQHMGFEDCHVRTLHIHEWVGDDLAISLIC